MLSSCLDFELNHEKKCHIIKTSNNPVRISRELRYENEEENKELYWETHWHLAFTITKH